MRSHTFLAALISTGILLCVCGAPANSPPTPAPQHSRPDPAPDTGHQQAAHGSSNTNSDSTATVASLAVAGGMILLQQQSDRGEICPGQSCESPPVSFLTLQPL